MEELTDAAVIEASLGRPAEFGTIFDRHATVVHRYVVRRLGPADAEAITGDVFRIAFERRATFDSSRAGTSARPWLYGIATNLVAKQRRTEIRRVHAVARLAADRGAPLDLADDDADIATSLRIPVGTVRSRRHRARRHLRELIDVLASKEAS